MLAKQHRFCDVMPNISEPCSIVIAPSGARPLRYRLLDMTRAYAAQKLADAGEATPFLRRHAEYLRTLFDRDRAVRGAAAAVPFVGHDPRLRGSEAGGCWRSNTVFATSCRISPNLVRS